MSSDSRPYPDWSKVPLNDQYTWTDATSSNGQPYKIGAPKAAATSAADEAPAGLEAAEASVENFSVADAANKTPFDISVNWTGGPPPPGFATFKKPSPEETATTSITSYNLTTGPLSYNEFSFTCTEAYNFTFYDKTGDSYGCNVFWPRSATVHFFMYFSSDPTIVRVTGK